jgi:hypothetical protein
MQPCIYPRVEDTCTVEHRPDGNATMEEAPLIAGVAESKDAIEIECALRNASINGCKDALLAFRSFDDDEDEGDEEHEGDTRMSDNLSFGGVGSTGATHESDSNLVDCSGQGNEGQPTQMVDQKAVHSLADDVDPYEDAMRDDPDVGFHAFLPSKPQSFDPNIPHDKVCIYSTCLFNFKSVLYLLVNTFCLP